jgi:hypothetical protein
VGGKATHGSTTVAEMRASTEMFCG